VRAGRRAVLCFVVQRKDATWVGPADAVDPEYGETLRAAATAGVELIAYRAAVGTSQIAITEPMPVRLHPPA